jgi:hypothetical protein
MIAVFSASEYNLMKHTAVVIWTLRPQRFCRFNYGDCRHRLVERAGGTLVENMRNRS